MSALRKRQGGFTLLELLMVVIIVAILAAIALPQYLRLAERTRPAEITSMMASIRQAEIVYRGNDPAQKYGTDFALLDVDLSQYYDGGSTKLKTANWDTIIVDGTAGGANVKASRTAGTQALKALYLDLDTGAICADDATAATVWQVTLSKVAGDCP